MDRVAGCQLSSVYREMGSLTTELGFADRLRFATRSLFSSFRRRLGALPPAAADGGSGCARPGGAGRRRRDALQPGELVRVRSLEEITATLVDGKTQGLEFMPGMARYCGSTVRVMKRVRCIFDEREWKMRRCDSVLLEGAVCDGRNLFDSEGCDRSCFYFWKDAWLEKA
jgi:hypothetical protein